mgnify:CR=1 FL=1
MDIEESRQTLKPTNMKKIALLLATIITISASAQVVSSEPEKEFKCKGQIYVLGVNATGDKLIAGTDDGAQVFDMGNGKKLFDLEFEDNRHDKAVFYLAFDETGRYCAGVGRYGARVVWDLETGDIVENANSMHWLPTSADTKNLGLNTKNAETDFPYQQREATVPGDDDKLATAKGCKIEFFSTSAYKVVQTLTIEGAKTTALLPPVYFEGEYLITATDAGTIGFYKLQ